MRNLIPNELSFINEFRLDKTRLIGAKWLKSNFDDNVWRVQFGESLTMIDFKITLADGSLLTHRSNALLLISIKHFLCAQTHPTVMGVAAPSSNTGKTLLSRALHVLDYFLLRGSFNQEGDIGFRLLSMNDMHCFIDTISNSRAIKNNIYEPEKRIFEFIRSLKVDAEDITKMRRKLPSIFEKVSVELPKGIDDAQVHIARIWLYKRRFYNNGGNEDLFKHQLSVARLLKHIIRGHTLANLKFDNLDLDYLSFGLRETFIRELPAAPVQPGGEDERASAEYVQSYVQTVCVMGCEATATHCLLEDDALTAFEDKEAIRHGRLKQKGRFATLPFEVANQSFKCAIEFYLEYGQELVDYYLSLAEKNLQEICLGDLPKSLRKLGIRQFESTATVAKTFFTDLRHGISLYQMLQVLTGAIIIIVNTLMARRSSELLGLTRESIVMDGNEFFLAFDLGKANIEEIRKRALRPLPELGAEGLRLLANLSERLTALGYEASPTLFQHIKLGYKPGNIPYGTHAANRQWMLLCLDRFCDYFEIATDSKGRRYYIRTHQLRRNFAMLFFWQGSFGGIHVLRGFLGHQKPSLTYRYVTEPMKGAVLRHVKAKVATELIMADSAATESLANFICARYRITIDALHILPEADVIAYVEDLLESKEAEVEPEFFEGPNGEEYRILYKVCAHRSKSSTIND